MADFTQITADLNLRYSGTIVRYRPNSASKWDTVVFVEATNSSGSVPDILLRGLQGTQMVSYGTEGEFNFEFPDAGCFNHGNTGYAFFRRPSRQNKRALCNSTSLRINHYTQARMALVANMDMFVADALYNPKFPSKSGALALLNSRSTYCVALSRDFLLGLNTRKDSSHLLFHRLTPIAEISPQGEVSAVLHPSFEGKVNEYLS